MIKTLLPIKIPKKSIRDDYLKSLSCDDNWKYISEDTTHITIDCVFIDDQNNKLVHDIDWKIIDDNNYQLPPPFWLLIKLKELSNLIFELLINDVISIPFCNWIINDDYNKNLIIIKLNNIGSWYDIIIYNVTIITLECLSSSYPDHVYEIKIFNI